MSALVYQAITAVTAELSATGIAKSRRNEEGDYAYRSIDDVLAALAPLLARHKLCVLPRVIEREAHRLGRNSQLVTVRAAFDLVSSIDGSVHTTECFGEAIDDSDKGTAKAISSAYKSAMLQAFCIPVGEGDADGCSPRLNGHPDDPALSEPPEGWDSWTGEVMHIASTCVSAEAIERLTCGRRAMLVALQRSRPELYAKVGEAIAETLAKLQRQTAPTAHPKGGVDQSDSKRSGNLQTKPITKPATKQRRGANGAGQPAEAA